jgi:DNA polymerase-3 subunit epsilon
MGNLNDRLQAIQLARQVIAQNPVYIDTETTGISQSDEIIEIAIVDNSGQVIYESFVRPGQPIPPDATRVNHITDDMVQGKPTWPAIWPTVRSFVFGKIICAYNAKFDMRMMQQSLVKYGMPWKENLKSFCVMELYARFRGDFDPNRRAYRIYSLDNARIQCGISLPNSHRAAADTLLARELLYYMANTEK